MAQDPWLEILMAGQLSTELKSQAPEAQPERQAIYFIFFFYFLTKGLHIINSLTKTKVLVTEFEKHFFPA